MALKCYRLFSGTREYGWCGGFDTGRTYMGASYAEAHAAYTHDPDVPARYVGRYELREVAS